MPNAHLRAAGYSFPSAVGRILLDPNPDPPAAPPATAPPAPDRGQAFIDKHGSASEAVSVLMRERDADRQKIAELQARVPREGSRVLEPEQAAIFDRYLALGKAEDLSRAMKDNEIFSRENAAFKREKQVNEVAGKLTIDGRPVNARVLATLAGDLPFEEKTVKDASGKDVTTMFVKFKDGDKEKEESAESYFKAHHPEFLPSLAPAPATSAPSPTGTPRHQPTPRLNTPPTVPGQATPARPVLSRF